MLSNEIRSLRREDLARIFRDAFPRTRLHFNKQVVSVQRSTHGNSVEFQDGTKRTCDLLVGADGDDKFLRKLVIPRLPARPTHFWWRLSGLVKIKSAGGLESAELEASAGFYKVEYFYKPEFVFSMLPGGSRDVLAWSIAFSTEAAARLRLGELDPIFNAPQANCHQLRSTNFAVATALAEGISDRRWAQAVELQAAQASAAGLSSKDGDGRLPRDRDWLPALQAIEHPRSTWFRSSAWVHRAQPGAVFLGSSSGCALGTSLAIEDGIILAKGVQIAARASLFNDSCALDKVLNSFCRKQGERESKLVCLGGWCAPPRGTLGMFILRKRLAYLSSKKIEHSIRDFVFFNPSQAWNHSEHGREQPRFLGIYRNPAALFAVLLLLFLPCAPFYYLAITNKT
ncbi:hypothetical protein CYMTET_8321 [Cymbomonas tetramitiformis]|uniref:FAD-binding domain-containing protein n=1 Tax=Cymbomonas tetramitiformis TaxID=36881 RepID=A0AAE0GT98_9CHLO|nr:hypothetical protein CYMTET_8321 [Cymbomonas tetramitiformis]